MSLGDYCCCTVLVDTPKGPLIGSYTLTPDGMVEFMTELGEKSFFEQGDFTLVEVL